MAKTTGFIGTLEMETRGINRIWFSLTEKATGNDWIKMGKSRAWFTINMELDGQQGCMVPLTLLLDAMHNGLQVQVSHGGAADFQKEEPNDSFEVEGIRILRKHLSF